MNSGFYNSVQEWIDAGMPLNSFVCGDCMEGMATMPEKFAGLAIVDPPYGLGWDRDFIIMSAGIRKDGSIRHDPSWKNRRITNNYKSGKWDEKPSKEYFDLLKKVSTNRIVFGGNYFSDRLDISAGWIVWNKGVPDGMSLSQAELAWTDLINSVKIINLLWAGYKKCETVTRIHTTQKPVKLYLRILSDYAKPGDIILDTHVGSASSLIACEQMGFSYVGFEIDSDYYQAACKRILQARELLKQQDIFAPDKSNGKELVETMKLNF